LRGALACCGALAVALALTPAASSKPGVAPHASLVVGPNPANPNETVTFNGSGSTADGQGSTIASYVWDLDGDGTFETDSAKTSTVSRAYPSPGSFAARLRVTDSEGDISEASVDLRINAPPTAGFIYQPDAPAVGKRVTLSSTSTDPDGAIPPSGYAWDIDGDHLFDDAAGESVTVSFQNPGKHKVRLLVTDADGLTAKRARKIDVAPERSRLKLMKPFPTVRLAGAISSDGGTEIDLLAVRGPNGAKATVECRHQGCPLERQRLTIKHKQVEFHQLEQRLRPGIVLRVYVTQAQRIGKFTRFKLRDGEVPKREDRCVRPGTRRPIDCPR
jgi:hypothetical protein